MWGAEITDGRRSHGFCQPLRQSVDWAAVALVRGDDARRDARHVDRLSASGLSTLSTRRYRRVNHDTRAGIAILACVPRARPDGLFIADTS